MLILGFAGEIVGEAALAFQLLVEQAVFAHSLADCLELFNEHLVLRGREVGDGGASVQQVAVFAVCFFIEQIGL